MVELPHALVGAAIAAKLENPALALPLAFASHYILDLVPHSNPSIYTQIKEKGSISKKSLTLILIDSFGALIAGFLIALSFLPDNKRVLLILFGAFFAVLPDVLEIPYYFFSSKNPLIVRYVELNHSLQTSAPIISGILTQVAVSAAAVWWIFT